MLPPSTVMSAPATIAVPTRACWKVTVRPAAKTSSGTVAVTVTVLPARNCMSSRSAERTTLSPSGRGLAGSDCAATGAVPATDSSIRLAGNRVSLSRRSRRCAVRIPAMRDISPPGCGRSSRADPAPGRRARSSCAGISACHGAWRPGCGSLVRERCCAYLLLQRERDSWLRGASLE